MLLESAKLRRYDAEKIEQTHPVLGGAERRARRAQKCKSDRWE